jgi:magnesium-transporting ATPase (P-type)
LQVTGDNALTGMAVAEECGILSPAADVWLSVLGSTLSPAPANAEQSDSPASPLVVWQHVKTGQVRHHLKDVMHVPHTQLLPSLVDPQPRKKSNVGQDLNAVHHTGPDGKHVQLVVTGPCFAALLNAEPAWLPSVLSAGRVFARFTPDQKGDLVTLLQANNTYVAMVRFASFFPSAVTDTLLGTKGRRRCK